MDIRPNLYQKSAFIYDFDNRDIVATRLKKT